MILEKNTGFAWIWTFLDNDPAFVKWRWEPRTEKRSRANEKIQAELHKPLSISLYEIPSFILTEKISLRKRGGILYFPELTDVR